MKKKYETFYLIKSNEIKRLQDDLKEKVERAVKKEYAKESYLENLNLIYAKMQRDFYSLSRFLIELEQNQELGLDLNTSRKEFDKFTSEQIIKLAHISALRDFLNEIYKSRNVKEKTMNKKSSIIWKGKNQTEFVQLIYSLFHSETLTIEGNEKTKLVEEIAIYFNIKLSEHWQSNLSKAINKRNNDYEPQIIETIKSGYNNYKKEIKDKRNTSK
jgi:hypothetical protein